MRAIWLIFALIALLASALVWTFIAGWAGRLVFLPDLELLRSGEWLSWACAVILMYGPLGFAGWMLAKAYKKDL